MIAGPVLKAATGGVTRRWVQTAVIFVVVGVATASGVLGLTLANGSNRSFWTAVAQRRAPDLSLQIDTAKVTVAELDRTRHLFYVAKAAGPYPETSVVLRIAGPSDKVRNSGLPLVLVGRTSRSGPLDVITQNSGRWPAHDGQVALANNSPTEGSYSSPYPILTATVSGLRSRPKLAVIGYGSSMINYEEDGWVTPAEIATLEKAGAPVQEQMLYDFKGAANNGQINTKLINADLARLKAALPAAAIISSATLTDDQYTGISFLAQRPQFVETFAVILLVLALLIAAIIVAASVVAGYHRIGVLKSIGFTPAQVIATYLAQLAFPAVAGAIIGTVLGNDWAVPLINGGLAHIHVGAEMWIMITAPVAVCVLVALAGVPPAMRAARLTAMETIAASQTPGTAGGSHLSRLVSRCSLPRPVTLGLTSAFSRPAASLAAGAMVAVGFTAAVLAVGLDSQMPAIAASNPGSAIVTQNAAFVHRLTVLTAIVAALGILTATLMLVRQRVHDLGVCKAVGMTPRQAIAMIVSWVLAPAVIATAIALPAGVALERAVAQATVNGETNPQFHILGPTVPPTGPAPTGAAAGNLAPASGNATRQLTRPGAGSSGNASSQAAQSVHGVATPSRPGGARLQLVPTRRPTSQLVLGLPSAYNPGTLALIILAGLAVAILGALGPATWAALSKTTTALHAE